MQHMVLLIIVADPDFAAQGERTGVRVNHTVDNFEDRGLASTVVSYNTRSPRLISKFKSEKRVWLSKDLHSPSTVSTSFPLMMRGSR